MSSASSVTEPTLPRLDTGDARPDVRCNVTVPPRTFSFGEFGPPLIDKDQAKLSLVLTCLETPQDSSLV